MSDPTASAWVTVRRVPIFAHNTLTRPAKLRKCAESPDPSLWPHRHGKRPDREHKLVRQLGSSCCFIELEAGTPPCLSVGRPDWRTSEWQAASFADRARSGAGKRGQRWWGLCVRQFGCQWGCEKSPTNSGSVGDERRAEITRTVQSNCNWPKVFIFAPQNERGQWGKAASRTHTHNEQHQQASRRWHNKQIVLSWWASQAEAAELSPKTTTSTTLTDLLWLAKAGDSANFSVRSPNKWDERPVWISTQHTNRSQSKVAKVRWKNIGK